MNCPPEDSGGINGFYEKMKAVKNKKHPDHEEVLDWLGDYDMTEFDLELTNKIVQLLTNHNPN